MRDTIINTTSTDTLCLCMYRVPCDTLKQITKLKLKRIEEKERACDEAKITTTSTQTTNIVKETVSENALDGVRKTLRDNRTLVCNASMSGTEDNPIESISHDNIITAYWIARNNSCTQHCTRHADMWLHLVLRHYAAEMTFFNLRNSYFPVRNIHTVIEICVTTSVWNCAIFICCVQSGCESERAWWWWRIWTSNHRINNEKSTNKTRGPIKCQTHKLCAWIKIGLPNILYAIEWNDAISFFFFFI